LGSNYDRFFIRIIGDEIGWVYLHQHGMNEDTHSIHLVNELVPGDEITKANKAEYKEISKAQYDKVIHENENSDYSHDTINSLIQKND
jgi:hypothetical protein